MRRILNLFLLFCLPLMAMGEEISQQQAREKACAFMQQLQGRRAQDLGGVNQKLQSVEVGLQALYAFNCEGGGAMSSSAVTTLQHLSWAIRPMVHSMLTRCLPTSVRGWRAMPTRYADCSGARPKWLHAEFPYSAKISILSSRAYGTSEPPSTGSARRILELMCCQPQAVWRPRCRR